MSGIFEQLLEEQKKTNELLAELVAGGTHTPVQSGESDALSRLAASAEEENKAAPKKAAPKKAAPKKEPATAKPKHTKDEVVAAVIAVKDAFDTAAAKEITASFGLSKIALATEDQFDAIFEACNAKLQEANTDGADDDEV